MQQQAQFEQQHTLSITHISTCLRPGPLIRYLSYAGVPLNNASWIGTHNSFNTEADSTTRLLFEEVPNQIYTVPEQLVLGARVVEVCDDYCSLFLLTPTDFGREFELKKVCPEDYVVILYYFAYDGSDFGGF